MATLTSQKPCVTNTSGSTYFNNYSGTYTYNFVNQLNNLGITADNITAITFTLDTHYLRASTSSDSTMDDSYNIIMLSSSSATTGTEITNSITLNNTNTTSITQLANTKLTVTNTYRSSVISKLLSGNLIVRISKPSRSSQDYFYYGPSNTSSLTNSNKGLMTCTITYTAATVTDPTNLTITQNLNGTYTLKWNASTGTGGSGSVTYSIKDTDGITIATNWASTSYTGNIPGYDYIYTWRVTAHYSGAESNAVRIDTQFYPPSIEKPTWISIYPSSGDSVTVSWASATLKYTTGDINYSLYYRLNNGSYKFIKSLTNTSITFYENDLSGWGEDGDTFIFQVDAYASNLSNSTNGNSLGPVASADSSNFTFTTGNVVAYCNGSTWQECKVWYCTGNSWIECVPYCCVYDSSEQQYVWKEINSKVN